MNAPRVTVDRSGVTIVELMMAMLAGSILALTSGIVLMHGYRVWSRNTAATAIQRDAAVTVEMLQRKLREAASPDVVVDASANPYPTIGVTLADGSTATFSATVAGGATSLVYTAGNQTTVLADGTLSDFQVQEDPGSLPGWIRVQFTLAGGVRPDADVVERVEIDATVHYRN